MSKIPESKALHVNNRGGVPFYSFPSLDELPGVVNAYSTRLGGVSSGVFESMNLGFSRGDERALVEENFHRFCDAVGMPYNRIVISHQTHTKNVRCVTEEDAGSGVLRERTYDDVDGLITNIPNLPLCTLYADCVPLYFADPVKRVVAISHAGWRGTVLQIGKETVEKMASIYGCIPANIHAAVGPSIGKCCFEIDKPVYDEFSSLPFFDEKCGTPDGNGKYHVDLWEVNKRVLLLSGIREENISVTDVCTRCHPKELWSHRFTGPERGSAAGFIMLQK